MEEMEVEEEGEVEMSSCSNSSQQLPLHFNEKEMLGRELEEIAQRRAVTMTKIGKLRKEIQVLQVGRSTGCPKKNALSEPRLLPVLLSGLLVSTSVY